MLRTYLNSRNVLIMLVLLTLVSLAGCGGGEEPAVTEVNPVTTEQTARPLPVVAEPTATPLPADDTAPLATTAEVASAAPEAETEEFEYTGVIEITLHNGDVFTGALDSVSRSINFYTVPLNFYSLTELTQTREGKWGYFETDDPDLPSWEYLFDESSDDLAVTVNTTVGIRIISMYNVKKIMIDRSETIRLKYEKPYVRPKLETGATVNFTPKGTATIYLKDGSSVETFPQALPFISTEKIEVPSAPDDGIVLTDFAQTRDFYPEEAKTIYITEIDRHTLDFTGELVLGESIKKRMTSLTSDWGVWSVYEIPTPDGIYTLVMSEITRVEIDSDVTPKIDLSETAKITLSDGTVFNTPTAAVTYRAVTTEGSYGYHSGLVVKDADGNKVIPFSDLSKAIFLPDLYTDDATEFPGTVIYKDGKQEDVSFDFGDGFLPRIVFFCPFKYEPEYEMNIGGQPGGGIESIEFF